MSVDSMAVAIARAAVKLPPGKKLPWWQRVDNLPPNAIHCGAFGPFCAQCPEEPPCVGAGVVVDCQDCTAENRMVWNGADACPCWTRSRGKRQSEFEAWQEKTMRDNRITDERRGMYVRRRWLIEQGTERPRPKPRGNDRKYQLGRTCSICGTTISDKGQTGMCKPCWARATSGARGRLTSG